MNEKKSLQERKATEKPKKRRFVEPNPNWRAAMERAQLYGSQASIDAVWASIPDEFFESMRD